ncbi:nitrate- and nitrite sensing domain-containing protein [Nocardia sp. R7R-8]|uniref:nitrate- and nitrite sensing domain-containing protein n=1 Tax=Nocardia sp. R7R-8 TaxID=3459304 RepID=UPI00403D760B
MSRVARRGLQHGRSIRTRLLAIVLLPCVALLAVGTIAVGYLANDARYADRWSRYLNAQLDPLLGLVTSVQAERALSLLTLAGDPTARAGLPAARAQTDQALGGLGVLAPQLVELSPKAIESFQGPFESLVARSPDIRSRVDQGRADVAAVDDYYKQMATLVVTGFEAGSRYSPDPTTSAEESTAADMLRVAELHARSVAHAAAAAASGEPVPAEERRFIGQLVGGYRYQLEGFDARLTAEGRRQLTELFATPEWRTVLAAEDQLSVAGTLPVPYEQWLAAERVVGDRFVALFNTHMRYANGLAVGSANQALERSIWAGIAVAVIALCTFALAVVSATQLVRRLRSLRSRSLQLATETLPSIIDRLRDGQEVDVDSETTLLDRGDDEIGEVAAAFSAAQRVAMEAAAGEARTREGFNKVFMDIAHRSQVVVRRQLDVLDLAESKQQESEHLELLFQLDHLATRARRNAENLLILGGGHPGRRWRNPVALEQIVRSAVSETQDLNRVSAVRLPHTFVIGNAVADLVHLLAELIDNATFFSPPQSPVSVHGNLVGRGVVVEIEDQGLGIRAEERERLNALLRDAPDFQEMALAGQRHLGLFVVGRLANKHGISVTLQDSAYGGVKAIVLIPAALLDVEQAADAGAGPEPRRLAQPAAQAHPALEAVAWPAEPVVRSTHFNEFQLPPWPGSDGTSGVDPAVPPAPITNPSRSRAAAGSHEQRRSRTPLPRRRRQTHLAPELQIEHEQVDPYQQVPDHRSADQVRRSMEALQHGTRQARADIPNSHH